MKSRMPWAIALAGAACASLALVPAAMAGGPSITVVGKNLNNPRGLAAAPDGSIYVAEAGKAGPTCLDRRRENCAGFSSAVTRIRNGRQSRVVTGLVSIGGQDGSFTTGADGVSVTPNGSLLIAMADAPCGTPGIPARVSAQLGRVLIKPAGARFRTLADVAAVECRSNPDRTDRNSNPYAVLALDDDSALVADAGANVIWKVDGARVSVFARIPKNGRAQAVPTSVVRGPDGAIYVGELAEGAGRGKARVFRIPAEGGAPRNFRTGFSAISGLAFDGDGNLYVTELSTNFARQAPGQVTKVTPTGAKSRVAGGQDLMFPSGAAIGTDGDLYVSRFSILPATTPRNGPFRGAGGQVVKIDLGS